MKRHCFWQILFYKKKVYSYYQTPQRADYQYAGHSSKPNTKARCKHHKANIFAKAEGAGTIATQDIIALGKGNKKLVKLSQLQSAYPGLKVDGFSDGTFTAKRLFELYLEENLDGGQPCAVLIRNNYHGSWKNVLVVVMDYRNGNVSYQDPKASTYGTMDISTFIQYAKDASEAEDGIPKVNVVHW